VTEGAATGDSVLRTEVDGVPVFWRQGPPPLSAALVFGVGRRDETFLSGGITHLVEHLTMRPLRRTHLDHDAEVELSTTTFSAAGEPDAVAGFLTSVCRTLADLPVCDLDVEKAVLDAENGSVLPPPAAQAIVRRYGARDLGLGGLSEPARGALGAEQVADWARQRFVRQAAALALTGPPPRGLRFPLPEGRPPRREPVQGTHRPLPGWDQAGDTVAIAFVRDHSQAAAAGVRIAVDRATELVRHQRGLAYVVAVETERVDALRLHVTVWADGRRGTEREVLGLLLGVFHAVADNGPTTDELGYDREGAAAYARDPRSIDDQVVEAAVAHLFGVDRPSPSARLAELDRLTPAEVAEAMRRSLSSALVLVPEDVELHRPGYTRWPESTGAPAQGRSLRRRLWGSEAPPGSRLVLGDEAVSVVFADGEHMTVRYDEAVAVGVDPGGTYRVLTPEGRVVPVDPADFRGAEHAVDVLRTRVPAHLFFDDESCDQDEDIEED